MAKNYVPGMRALLSAASLVLVTANLQGQTLSGTTNCAGSLLTVTSSVTPTQIVWQLGGIGLGTVTATIAANGTTVAGTGDYGYGSGASQLNHPYGVYVDGSGNIYVADNYNNRIQEWAPGATSGTTVAGTGVSGSDATQLSQPTGVYVDGSGNIYVADENNNRIQEWAPGATSGITVAGTGVSGSDATQLSGPFGVYVDGTGNIYVADYENSRIQEWAAGATSGTTVAGTGVFGSDATQLSNPTGVYVDGSGNIYVADNQNARIQKWAPGATSGATVAGSAGDYGSGASQLGEATGVWVDGSGNIYIADISNSRIQEWAPGATSGTTVAGGNGNGSGSAQLQYPFGVYVDGGGNIYVADEVNNRIEEWAPGGTTGTAVAGMGVNGLGATRLLNPTGVCVDGGGNIYVADQNNNRIEEWAPGATSGTMVAGTGVAGSDATQLSNPEGVYVDGSGNIYIADGNNARVQKWAPGATSGTTVAGMGGEGSGATQLSYPYGVYVDGSGNIYVADQDNYRIQKWAAGATTGTTVAGTGFFGSDATQLAYPTGVYVDGSGNIYVADQANNRVQEWAPGSTSGTTVAGTGIYGSDATQLGYPTGVYVDGSGNIYVSDYANARIQEWTAGATSGTTVAGIGGSGCGADQLYQPFGVYLDGGGNIYVADAGNDRVQEFGASIITTYNAATAGNYAAVVTTVAGSSTTNTVTVNGVPNAGAISGASSVTAGGNITLSDPTASGGVGSWSSSSTGIATVGAGTGVVTGVAVGTATISYEISNSCGTAYTTLVITVPGSETATLTGSTTCAPSILTATSSLTPTEIVWQLGGTGISTVTATVTGTTVAGETGVSGTSANLLADPIGLYVDGSGNIYVADGSGNRIQKWAPGATSGSTVAGSSTGVSGSGANQFNHAYGVYVDGSGDIYVADYGNNRIQEWAPGATAGVTVAGGNGNGAGANQLRDPDGVYVDGSGNIYVADYANDRIQEWAPGATSGTTVAGTTGSYGSAANQLGNPYGVYVDGSGNIYIADGDNNRIQKWAPGATAGTTVAGGMGGGDGANQLNGPTGVYLDNSGNIYIADNYNSRIQKWAPGATTGITVAGSSTDISGSGANQLDQPTGVHVDGSGNIYVADLDNKRIQEFTASITTTYNPTTAGDYNAVVTTVAGNITTNTVTVNALPTISAGPNVAICAGTTTTLNATGGVSYVWSPDATLSATTGASVIANPITMDTYTVTGTDANGCMNTASVTVSVNASLNVGSTGGGIAICSGSTATLNGTGATSYSWSGGISNGVAFTPGVGINTYTVTGTTGSCSNTATVTVTVNLTPTVGATGGGVAICSGNTATLSGTGATSYSWSGGISDGVAFTPGVGINTYTVTGTTGSCSSTAAATVTVNALPSAGAISGPLSVYTGSNITLTDAITAGSWSASNGNATVAGGLVTGVTAGTVVISYGVTNSCGTAYATSVITINNPSILGTDVVCAGNSITLTNSTPGGTWSMESLVATIAGSTGVMTASTNYAGTATVTYTVGGVHTTRVVTVYPNPTPIQVAALMCAGTITTLSDATAGGAWSGTGDASVSGVGTAGIFVAGAIAGTAVISYTLPTGCYTTIIRTIYANPQPIQGNFNMCVGIVTDLSDASGPGSWSSSNNAIAMTSGPDISGERAGVATITFRNSAAGTCFTTVVVTVSVMPVVTAINGPVTISHASGAVTISDATAGGVWTSSNAGVIALGGSTGSPVSATALTTTGSSVITYAVTIAGCTTKVTKTIGAAAATHPDGGTTAIYAGAVVSLADDLDGGMWGSSDNGIAAVDANGLVTGIMPGNAVVTHESIGDDGVVARSVTNVAVSALPANISILPNPNKGTFVVRGAVGSVADEAVTLEVTDLLGQVIYRHEVTSQGGRLNEMITLSNALANGMYILNVQSEAAKQIFHFVVAQ